MTHLRSQSRRKSARTPHKSAIAEVADFWVEDPEVDEVLVVETGVHLRHDLAIGSDLERVIKLRHSLLEGIQNEQPLYRCAMCMVPVYLVSRAEERRFFFRHTLEDGRCSAKTRGSLSQDEIDARRYNGVKESRAHINMKNWVADSLRSDPNFTDVEVEQRWAGKFNGEWRKPDVRATYKGLPVVFEVQLSTTYLNVILARRSFYQREGALLLWIFATFDEGPRRLIQDDVFFTNNRNAFVVSASTRETSVAGMAFHLECMWARPTLTSVPQLVREVVAFEALTLEPEQQRAYYFDFDGERERLLLATRQAELGRTHPLRDAFERWYLAGAQVASDDAEYAALRNMFASAKVPLPWYPLRLPRTLLNALYSAKHGRPVGWSFRTFMEVLHHVHGMHKQYLRLFRHALVVFARGEQIRAEDKNRKWRAKVKEYTPLLVANDPRFDADTSHDALIQVLFPELLDEPL